MADATNGEIELTTETNVKMGSMENQQENGDVVLADGNADGRDVRVQILLNR